ncbi:MAG: dienelactone hydrolase family protein [bacterium]|nr:dienelactone hydrolase family protein [bacterium]
MRYALIAVIAAVAIGGSYYYWQTRMPSDQEKNSDMLKSDDGGGIVTEDAGYFENTRGFYAAPKAPGNYPGVVMIHEWWGLNDHIRDMARELARQGYRVLAVDLFGKVAATPDEARSQVSGLDQAKATENLRAAAAFLRAQGAGKLASLGWCFGGAQSLKLALSGEKLDATVIYYGNLVTDPAELKKITWPVLGIFGATDQSIPVATVNMFRNALSSLGIRQSVHIYPGVGHAFANPSGMNYAPAETKDAWAKTVAFLAEHLK